MPTSALAYHEATKHRFDRFARSAGALDWSTQPNPFRRFAGAPLVEFPRQRLAPGPSFDDLYEGGVRPAELTLASVGELFRCSFGLSAWKSYRETRWALRVNPSSGNLHPTEAYAVWDGAVFHYAADLHALERRATLARAPSADWSGDALLVGLTSIHWREAWKYGERAYRYCQHDIGHAIGALRYAAALLGWRLAVLPEWADADIAALLGLDRDQDFAGAEREVPACLIVITVGDLSGVVPREPSALVGAARAGEWRGTANRLSSGHVEWPLIDDVAAAAAYPGRERAIASGAQQGDPIRGRARVGESNARNVILRRRSALGFDPGLSLPLEVFRGMLQRLRPGGPPWDAIEWPPMVHLILFVHRVEELVPGVYVFLRDDTAAADLRAAMRPEFLWEPVHGLALLVPTDVTRAANRLSCDQDIAGDGFFSLAMLSRLEPALAERGDWFYRRLFWECGLIGQVLYLEAEAAGVRGTGIGCFYDDPVHEALGLTGHAWQSLYHFAMGAPVEDARLTTEPGYGWESS